MLKISNRDSARLLPRKAVSSLTIEQGNDERFFFEKNKLVRATGGCLGAEGDERRDKLR